MPICYDENQVWPPKPFDEAQKDMELWSAWYAGDTDALADIYSDPSRQYSRKRYREGKLVGNDDKFFWGRCNQQATKRRHVPAPANLARASANLLFSKPPRISPSENDQEIPGLTERMEKIFGAKAFGAELSEAGELASALGNTYLRPWWDHDVADHVVPSHVHADHAVPEFRFNKLVAVTFWSILSDDGETPVIRYLERHEKGKNYHALYSGTENTLGEKLDLADHYQTKWLCKLVDNEGGICTGIDELDVVHVPNARPSRVWRGRAGLSALGRSDFEGLEPEFDALDEVHTSWLRDIEDGKAKVFIDEQYLTDLGPGRGGSYDKDQHLYVKLNTPMGAAIDGGGGDPINSVQFNIRWQEHAQTSAEIKSQILEAAGLSAQHMSDGPLAVTMTATEINARNSVSETTRNNKVNFWQAALEKFVEIVMKLDAVHFNTGLHMTEPPTIFFAPQAVVSDSERASTIATKRSSGFMSQETAVRQDNPEWTNKQVEEELARIRADEKREMKLALGQGLEEQDGVEANEGMEDETLEDEAKEEAEELEAIAEDEIEPDN